MKILTLILFILLITGCGFQPIYKISEDNYNLSMYDIQFNDSQNISRNIKEEFKKNFLDKNNTEKKFILRILVSENFTPIIINENGTVAKYRVDIDIDYELINKVKNSLMIKDTARGFAQYNTVTSEIENDQKKERMISSAANDAIQIMVSRIQSKVNFENVN